MDVESEALDLLEKEMAQDSPQTTEVEKQGEEEASKTELENPEEESRDADDAPLNGNGSSEDPAPENEDDMDTQDVPEVSGTENQDNSEMRAEEEADSKTETDQDSQDSTVENGQENGDGPKKENGEEDKIVRVTNIPFSSTDENLKEFFTDLEIEWVWIGKMYGKNSGEAFLEFKTMEDALKAHTRHHRTKMGDRPVSVYNNQKETYEKAKAVGASSEATTVVRMHGLPLKCSKQMIEDFFEGLEAEKILMPEEMGAGRPIGEAFVRFANREHYEKALTKHKEHIGHRWVGVLASIPEEMEEAENDVEDWDGSRGHYQSDDWTSDFFLPPPKKSARWCGIVTKIENFEWPEEKEKDIWFPRNVECSRPSQRGSSKVYGDGPIPLMALDWRSSPAPVPNFGGPDFRGSDYRGRDYGRQRSSDSFSRKREKRGRDRAYVHGDSQDSDNSDRREEKKDLVFPGFEARNDFRRTVQLNNLPSGVTNQELVDFFLPLIISNIKIPLGKGGIQIGTAEVEFEYEDSLPDALAKNRTDFRSNIVSVIPMTKRATAVNSGFRGGRDAGRFDRGRGRGGPGYPEQRGYGRGGYGGGYGGGYDGGYGRGRGGMGGPRGGYGGYGGPPRGGRPYDYGRPMPYQQQQPSGGYPGIQRPFNSDYVSPCWNKQAPAPAQASGGWTSGGSGAAPSTAPAPAPAPAQAHGPSSWYNNPTAAGQAAAAYSNQGYAGQGAAGAGAYASTAATTAYPGAASGAADNSQQQYNDMWSKYWQQYYQYQQQYATWSQQYGGAAAGQTAPAANPAAAPAAAVPGAATPAAYAQPSAQVPGYGAAAYTTGWTS